MDRCVSLEEIFATLNGRFSIYIYTSTADTDVCKCEVQHFELDVAEVYNVPPS